MEPPVSSARLVQGDSNGPDAGEGRREASTQSTKRRAFPQIYDHLELENADAVNEPGIRRWEGQVDGVAVRVSTYATRVGSADLENKSGELLGLSLRDLGERAKRAGGALVVGNFYDKSEPPFVRRGF